MRTSNTVPSKRVQLELWNVIFERKHQIKSQVISQNSKVAIWTLHWRLNLILSEWFGSGWCPSAAWWCFSLKRVCEWSVQDLVENCSNRIVKINCTKRQIFEDVRRDNKIGKSQGGIWKERQNYKKKGVCEEKRRIIKSGCDKIEDCETAADLSIPVEVGQEGGDLRNFQERVWRIEERRCEEVKNWKKYKKNSGG